MAKKQNSTPTPPAQDPDNDFASALGVLSTEATTNPQESENPDEDSNPDFDFPEGHPYYRPPAASPEEDEQDDDDNDDDQDSDPGSGQDKPGKENPSRFEYWQSQAAKLAAMNEKLLNMLEDKGQGSSQSGTPSAPVETPEMKIHSIETELQTLTTPDKPARPAGYNATDAVTDPDSESFRYRAQMDDWTDQFATITQKREKLRDSLYQLKLKQIEAPVAEMNKRNQLTEAQQRSVALLKNNYNFNEAEANDFVQMMSKPESMSMDNLVRFYKVIKGVKSPEPKTPATPRRNRSLADAAPPIPNGSGADDANDEEMQTALSFATGLLASKR